MAEIKALRDENGIIRKAYNNLPKEYIEDALCALAELEDNECHRTHTFPHTQLHLLKGLGKGLEGIYECYIDKTSGWRFQVKYNNPYIDLINLSSPGEHDRIGKVVKSKKNSF